MKSTKPLGHRAYGHIAHLPESRLGSGDHRISDGQARICCIKTRDQHDLVIVQEKVDGSNVAVAKLGGDIVPLIRSGYRAVSSRFELHHHFHNWVMRHRNRFEELLGEGERCVGEWLMQAHSTRYNLPHDPFVVFDIMRVYQRAVWAEVVERCAARGLVTTHTIHSGDPISTDAAMRLLGNGMHGAIDPVEGAVWRVEREGKVDFLAKYVRPDKQDGIYLPEISGKPAIWNWYPEAT